MLFTVKSNRLFFLLFIYLYIPQIPAQNFIKDSAVIVLKPHKYYFIALEYGLLSHPINLAMSDYYNLSSGSEILDSSNLRNSNDLEISKPILSVAFGRTKNNLYKQYFSSHSWTFGFLYYQLQNIRENFETNTYVQDTLISQQGGPDELIYYDNSKTFISQYESTNYGLKSSYLAKIFNSSRKFNVAIGAEMFASIGFNSNTRLNYGSTKGPSDSSNNYGQLAGEYLEYTSRSKNNFQMAILPMTELNWNPLRRQSMEFFVNYKFGVTVIYIPESRAISKFTNYLGFGMRYDLIPIQKKAKHVFPEEDF